MKVEFAWTDTQDTSYGQLLIEDRLEIRYCVYRRMDGTWIGSPDFVEDDFRSKKFSSREEAKLGVEIWVRDYFAKVVKALDEMRLAKRGEG